LVNSPFPIFWAPATKGTLPGSSASLPAVLASFVYVVAQIYGVGLITSRFIGIEFEIGVFVGLAGILVCSFLGGMRAVTWTQVAQYLILIIAYLVPVAILSYKVTGVPDPPGQCMGEVLQRSWREGTGAVLPSRGRTKFVVLYHLPGG
jgi:cation/acetate symporter